MKTSNTTLAAIIVSITLIAFPLQNLWAQQASEPWSEDQLLDPAILAEALNDTAGEKMPLILAVNPDGMYWLPYEGGIKGAKWFGPVEKQENLDQLRVFLEEIDRDEEIVLYCGCCPFNRCPNIRPAFNLLNTMGFSNHKLLDLPKNIKIDWMDKGYPMKE